MVECNLFDKPLKYCRTSDLTTFIFINNLKYNRTWDIISDVKLDDNERKERFPFVGDFA